MIGLSLDEIALAADTSVMITKNRIIQAVYELFGQLANSYRDAAIQLPEELLRLHPKIAKGENYLGLPWVMLDYPRIFSGTDIFAIRTLFWWGNYYSLQLLLKGRYMTKLNLVVKQTLLQKNEWFFCIGNDIWQHHFQSDYMIPVNELTHEIILQQQSENGFYKIGVKLPITEWNNAESFLLGKFMDAVQLSL